MDKKTILEKMELSINFLNKEISKLRTSRANPSLLDNIYVEAYGTKTPINQLGNINVPDANMLTIQIWDSSLIKQIETSILESDIGINPQIDGQLMRLPIPKLSEERRNDLAKIVSRYGEDSKVAVRNNRRDFIDKIKIDEKNKEISQDDSRRYINEIQKITDECVQKIDKIVLNKQQEILKV